MTLADGEFWGHELLLTDKSYPVSGRALNAARVYKLETDAFWRMLSRCPSILSRLVALLVERWGASERWSNSLPDSPRWARWPQAWRECDPPEHTDS
jgi:CRP-like cAMP-binding protein